MYSKPHNFTSELLLDYFLVFSHNVQQKFYLFTVFICYLSLWQMHTAKCHKFCQALPPSRFYPHWWSSWPESLRCGPNPRGLTLGQGRGQLHHPPIPYLLGLPSGCSPSLWALVAPAVLQLPSCPASFHHTPYYPVPLPMQPPQKASNTGAGPGDHRWATMFTGPALLLHCATSSSLGWVSEGLLVGLQAACDLPRPTCNHIRRLQLLLCHLAPAISHPH